KLNFHLLLPLGHKDISKINRTAHKYGLLSIADIKLNDIGNTNKTTTERLWQLGFDAVIVNPIMGLGSYR
ncbi:MAG: orotidine 5'-phosphate decarboxylase, partial [Candidatus Korarchaeota archaeon]|nr:orotidine 5'-phosphate decarboxylase [Candidatus Korarchaeota archaeon]